jgi:hypothetical protein
MPMDGGMPTPVPMPDAGITRPDAGALTLSCNAVLDCFSNCTTDRCAEDCFFATSPVGWTYLGPLVACANRQGCDDEDDWMSCAQTSCHAQYASCKTN